MENTPTVGTTVDRFGISTEFNGDKIKAAVAAAIVTEIERNADTLHAAGFGSALESEQTVQTEADINP